MNIVLLIGRLTHDVEIKEFPSGTTSARITLAVRRDFKNANGLYDTDFIPIKLWEGMAATCSEYCKKGSLVSIKCRIQINKWEDEEAKLHSQMELIGEKISLLTSNKTLT